MEELGKNEAPPTRRAAKTDQQEGLLEQVESSVEGHGALGGAHQENFCKVFFFEP